MAAVPPMEIRIATFSLKVTPFVILGPMATRATALVSRGGVGIGETHGIKLRNNLLLGNGTQIRGYNATGIDSDYNLLAPAGSEFAEGPHSIVRTSTTGIVVNLATGDFHPGPASPARAAGADLSATGLGTDLDGLVRPQGPAWDIGAYAFVIR